MKTATGCTKVSTNEREMELPPRWPPAAPSPALQTDFSYTNPVSLDYTKRLFLFSD